MLLHIQNFCLPLYAGAQLYSTVFRLIADHNGVMQTDGGTHGASDSSAGKGSRQVKGSSLVLKQFHALLVKRFHHAVRSQKDFIAQVSETHR